MTRSFWALVATAAFITGIYLISYCQFTPGTQWGASFFAGVCVGAGVESLISAVKAEK